MCGHDIGTAGFSGDIQGGWVAANAVLGTLCLVYVSTTYWLNV